MTCHWHHARFDLSSGCTLDPFADDARGFDVVCDGDDVLVSARPIGDPLAHAVGSPRRRPRVADHAGDRQVGPRPARPRGAGRRHRPARCRLRHPLQRHAGGAPGSPSWWRWPTSCPCSTPTTRRSHWSTGSGFVARDTGGRPPRFPLRPFDGDGDGVDAARLADWYRRFVDTRSGDAAERVLATSLAAGTPLDEVERTMLAAVTDHVFLDGGHTLDFTNKAFEALDHVGAEAADEVLPTLVHQTARGEPVRGERHLAAPPRPRRCWSTRPSLGSRTPSPVERAPRANSVTQRSSVWAGRSWRTIRTRWSMRSWTAIGAGATAEQLGRGLAYAAALRIARFHVQNDFGDWDTVHHAFTTANALHHALVRTPVARAVPGSRARCAAVYLDRFLNVPAARRARRDERRPGRARRVLGGAGRGRPGRRHRRRIPAGRW